MIEQAISKLPTEATWPQHSPPVHSVRSNPLHGITLEQILNTLVEHYEWKQLSTLINIQCFYNDPTIRSSLKFLRKNLSAREKAESLYIAMQR